MDWWRSAVIYQVYVRSFADGDGDGTGDLAGVRARLPYLAELGVDALWFNPWYLSPMKDGGYDVADYRAIDPAFGTLAEAEKLIAEARELGLRTIVDIVPNHVSDQTRGSRRPSPRDPAARSVNSSTSGADAARTANCRPTPGRPSSPAPQSRSGPGCPTATGICTCSRRSSRTSTGPTRPSVRSTRTSCASGSSAASRASASTRRPCSPRTPHCRTSSRAGTPTLSWTATNSTTSTAPGGPWPTTTTESSWARCGCRTPSASRATSAPTNCTRPSTSPSCPAPGTRRACARRSTRLSRSTPRWAPRPPGCCATTT